MLLYQLIPLAQQIQGILVNNQAHFVVHVFT